MNMDTRDKPGRVRWIIFCALWILILLNFIDRAALTIALPNITHEFKLTTIVEGILLGSFFWAYLIFQIPGGYFLDRFGPRRVIGAASIIWSLFQIAGGFAVGSMSLIITRLGLGAAEAPMFPAGSKLNANWLPAIERARGATFVDAAGPCGAAVGGLIVSAIIGYFGNWRWAFFITGGVTIIVAIIYYIYLRDFPEQHPNVNTKELDYIRQGTTPTIEYKEDSPSQLPTVAYYLKDISFWGMMMGRFGWATVWWGIIGWTPSYLTHALGFKLSGVGWSTFLIYGMGVFGELIAGYFADRARRVNTHHNRSIKTLFGLSGIGTAIAIFIVANTTSSLLAIVFLSIAVFFINFGGVYWAIPAWLAPRQQVGTVGGTMNLASSLGGGIAPVIMGIAIGISGGYVGAFMFLGGAAILYVIGSMLIDFERPMAITSSTRSHSIKTGEHS